MSYSLDQIRSALKTTIRNSIPTLIVYRSVEEMTEVPSAIIQPKYADFDGAMGRGDHVWHFDCYIMVSRTEPFYAYKKLDSYITGRGPTSIPEAIYNTPNLGLDDSVVAHCYGMKDYGGSFNSAAINHIGAVLMITVHC